MSSTSAGEIFSPPRMIMSFSRPTTLQYPASFSIARSPVCIHPALSTTCSAYIWQNISFGTSLVTCHLYVPRRTDCITCIKRPFLPSFWDSKSARQALHTKAKRTVGQQLSHGHNQAGLGSAELSEFTGCKSHAIFLAFDIFLTSLCNIPTWQSLAFLLLDFSW